jgi:hypothetical protein
MQILPNTHISPETAFVVEDYPYGFRLRCKKRFWLDCHAKKGVRFMSQTTNPKRPGEVWNTPKASTYARFGGAMYLDDAGHVQWSGLTEYTNGAEAAAWRDTYGEGVPVAMQKTVNDWVTVKLRYDAEREGGADMRTAGARALIAFAKGETKAAE